MKRPFALLFFLFLFFSPFVFFSQARGQLTIESIFSEGGITGSAPETVQWSPDSSKISFLLSDDSGQHRALYYVDAARGPRAVLVSEEKLNALAPPISGIVDEREKERLRRYSVAGYQWAPDSKHLLFDSRGQLWYYSLDSGTAAALCPAPEPSSDPKFSPDGSRVAYVRGHNLYLCSVAGGSEKQLTKDGAEAVLLNGEVDWLYAEELDVRSNYFWSPGGSRLLFLQTNERPVPTYPITDWIPQHSKVDWEKYPQAGDPNPEVRLLLVSTGGKPKALAVGDRDSRDFYVPRFGWVDQGVAWAEVLNRAQTRMDLYFIDVDSGRSELMLSENEPDAWVEVSDTFRVLPSGDHFLWASWRDGHTHLYLYSFDKTSPLSSPARLERQLTKGDFEVLATDFADDQRGILFLESNAGDPRQRHLDMLKLGQGFSAPSSSSVTSASGSHHATFAPDGRHFVDNHSTMETPPQLDLCGFSSAGDSIAGSPTSPVLARGGVEARCRIIWQSHALDQYHLIKPEFLELKAADGKTTLYGVLLLPNHPNDHPNEPKPGPPHSPSLGEGGDRKPGSLGTPPNVAPGARVPLILNPYGGPGAQLVTNAWGGATSLFDQIMVRRGFAILKVDNRGTAGRGKVFEAATRRKFGELELADQLAALDQVLTQFPILDPDRLGWWGWSYGGYLTAYAMTHSARFKAGVAVAPVTDWLDYDSTYTERYMGLPAENAAGYRNSSAVNSAAALHGRLLLVHGTSDDNVHMQNTVQMVEALIAAGEPYDLQLYPGKTHSLAGSDARTQLFHRIQFHFERWLLNDAISAGVTPTGKVPAP